MSRTKADYANILKITTLFGSIQVFSIVISALRSKAIAILIGSAGIGISGLLVSTLGFLSTITGFGLETSGVREISIHSRQRDKSLRAIGVLRKLVVWTAVISFFIIIAISVPLSYFTFGNTEYVLVFCWLSIAIVFKQLTVSEIAILQALKRHRALAKANLWGSFVGLLVSLPLYYWFGIAGIVGGIIANAVATFIFARLYASDVETVSISRQEVMGEGKTMVRLGFFLSLNAVISTTTAFLIQIFVAQVGGISQAGFYNAGFALLNAYVGIIFTAMATDYFPKLASAASDDSKMSEIASGQSEVGILLISPIIVFFLAFCPFIVRVLYSAEFVYIVPFVSLGVVGMLFRMVSWSMGYILLAKGESRLFMRTGIGFNVLYLVLNCVGFVFLGLKGIGIAFVLHYIIHAVGLKIISSKKYSFAFHGRFYTMFAICLFFCIWAYLAASLTGTIKIILLAPVCIASTAYSMLRLQKSADIIGLLKRLKK